MLLTRLTPQSEAPPDRQTVALDVLYSDVLYRIEANRRMPDGGALYCTEEIIYR